MAWPRSADYFEAIQNPEYCFDDAELRRGQPTLDLLGMPRLCSGNFADVYQLSDSNQRPWAVKCFTREREVAVLQRRYQSISVHLEQAKLPCMVEFRFLEQGIRIRGSWYPIVKMRWVEGSTLETFVKAHLDRPKTIKALADLWVRLARTLRQADVTHADLQHGNVLLIAREQGEKVSLRLVDYDGMFLPALAQSASGEEGHPNYQHPQRFREHVYSAEVDRFSHLVIFCALRCLAAAGRPLWDRFGDDDRMLFGKKDFEAPGQSAVFQELWASSGPNERALVGQLILASQGPLDQVPLLEDLAGNGHVRALTSAQEMQIQSLLRVSREGRKSPPPLPPQPTSEPPARIMAVPGRLTEQPSSVRLPAPEEPRPFLGVQTVLARAPWLRWALPLVGLVLVLGVCFAVLSSESNARRSTPVVSNTRKDEQKEKAEDKKDNTQKEKAEDKKDNTQKEKETPPGKETNAPSSKPKDEPKTRPPSEIQPEPPSKERVPAGIYEAALMKTPSILVAQERPKVWKRLKSGSPIYTAETLVSLPGFLSEVRLDSGVRLTLRGHVSQFSIHPLMDYLLESAIVLHQTKDFDADLTLLRGRIYVSNSSKPVESRPAKVRVRFSDQVWDLTLTEANTEIGLDLLRHYTADGNWRAGEAPQTEVYLCVLKGKASLTRDSYHQSSLEAPPGNALLEWNNQRGTDPIPEFVLDEKGNRGTQVPPIWNKDLPLTDWRQQVRALKELLPTLKPEDATGVQARLAFLEAMVRQGTAHPGSHERAEQEHDRAGPRRPRGGRPALARPGAQAAVHLCPGRSRRGGQAL